MPDKNLQSKNTGIVFVINYFAFFLVNSLVIYLANQFYPQQVVLGTLCINNLWAVIHSMSTLALINTLAIPLVRELEKKQNRVLSTFEWFVIYFLINLAGIWVIGRFAEQLGLGIASWLVAAVLALILDLLQGVVMMRVEKMRE